MCEKRDISGFALKMIAIITMAIDHIGAIIVENMAAQKQGSAESGGWHCRCSVSL